MISTRTLSSDDVVYFMHVPKTAGTSFISVLAGYFSKEEFFPFGLPNYLRQYEKSELEAYRCFHGHFLGVALDEHLPRAPTCRVTMLRDPLRRTASYYRHMQSEKPNPHFHKANTLDLSSFLNDPDVRPAIADLQSRFLLWEAVGRSSGPDHQRSLEIAQRELTSFDFFGLTERFEESLLLMAFSLQLQPPAAAPRLNRSDTMANSCTSSTGRLVELFADELRQINRLDVPVYAHAVELFQQRYRQMLEVLSEGDADRLAGDPQQTRRALCRWLKGRQRTGQHRHRVLRRTAGKGRGGQRKRSAETRPGILKVPLSLKRKRSQRPEPLGIEIETAIEQSAGHCGCFDEMVLAEDGVTVQARGWAYDPTELRPAQAVLIVAGSSKIRATLQTSPEGVCLSAVCHDSATQRIIAHGSVDRPREDVVAHLRGRRIPLAEGAGFGWEARFHVGLLEKGDTSLRAYAYSPKRKMMIRIGPEMEIPKPWLKKAGKTPRRNAA